MSMHHFSSVFVPVLWMSANILAQGEIDPKLTEVWEPVPKVVSPGQGTQPPSDAVVLFDGTNMSQWKSVKGGDVKWIVQDSCLTVVKGTGDIETLQPFGDVQLHLEFRCPAKVAGQGQGRGNSGVFLQGRYEVQVLDSYNNATYSNGQCGSIYKQYIPLVNACRPPGEWQTYDIVYQAPRFQGDGTLISPAYVSVIQNGILLLNHVDIKGETSYRGQPKYTPHPLKAPLRLQEHTNPVSFRNIWVREL